ncbi:MULTISPECIES: hypothetical protein [Marinomonas]|uniref:Porin n=1 Tax=Marinomonas arctica TaxID=383750 RepID=A0A7H1J2Z1_9GAMM|nr:MULTISPECIES: hypothetical protein [Marinomonas]MCS7486572.1 hypothetical protein [Marinomonas sp. BSi20414]QNT04857.1 hypothetical protein IBG28_14270 [Marinomonas arctica]GGN31308.1 hypothetical protein GCM10011350_24890 [Marinomonas arctica]
MKAIKLASVFAVSAVAAAVSTATFAADAIITGEAGVEYVSYNSSANMNDAADGTGLGELELHVDTGLVYAELEFKTTDDSETGYGNDEAVKIGIEKLYVKQGAVSFGRFDGSVATGSFYGMDEIFDGVDLVTSAKNDTDNTGVRYKVTPELTIALEATSPTAAEDSEVGVAASYKKDFGFIKAGISGGAVGDANAANVGIQTVSGPFTVSLNYGVGEKGATGQTDVEQMTSSIALAATDALTFTLEYSNDLEAEQDGTYFIGELASGDLTYYVKNYNGDLTVERTIVGVKTFF